MKILSILRAQSKARKVKAEQLAARLQEQNPEWTFKAIHVNNNNPLATGYSCVEAYDESGKLQQTY